MPGAPTQTWYCSVFFRWNRTPAGGVLTSGGRDARSLPVRVPLPLLEQAHEAVVLQVARGGDHDVAGRVHRPVVRRDRPLRDVRDHLARADDGTTERVRAEHRLREEVVHELLRGVLVHRDLLEDHLALGVDVVEARAEDHVAHHVDGRDEVLVGHAGVDDRVLARRRSVQLAAERVEGLGDLLRVEAVGALEQEVLDEVREARLRPRSRPSSRRRSRSPVRPTGRTEPALKSPFRRSPARTGRISARRRSYSLGGKSRQKGTKSPARCAPFAVSERSCSSCWSQRRSRVSRHPRPGSSPASRPVSRLRVSPSVDSLRRRRADSSASACRNRFASSSARARGRRRRSSSASTRA